MSSADSKAKILNFLTFLEEQNVLAVSKIQRIKNAADTSQHPLDIIITELGLISESELLNLYSSFFKIDHLNSLGNVDVNHVKDIGFHYMLGNTFITIHNIDNIIQLIMADPFNDEVIATVEYFFEKDVKVTAATRKDIVEFLSIFEGTLHAETQAVSYSDGDDPNELDMERLKDIAREAPVIKLVNQLIQDGVDQSATDIHVEPWEDIIKVRFRVDGVLQSYDNIAKSMQAGLSTRLKILSGMNISERRLPQDGRIRMSVRGEEIDFRVSSVPSIHGETIVIRILERSPELLKLENLGFDEKAQGKLEKITSTPNGITLVTGPTGSGKTTTLYSVLRQLNDGNSKIFTVEDPVEYRLEGITQLQVDAGIGLDFADTLRSVLRQDPDTILIGEIRDLDTARIAIQAALTGHRVLATLHTNSAIGAITRLRDMGIDSFLLSATLRGVLSQRLVRKICTSCNGNSEASVCNNCNKTGVSGRTVMYEIFEVTNDVVKAISSDASEDDIATLAVNKGMVPLIDHAQELVKNNITNQSEILRVTRFEVEDG